MKPASHLSHSFQTILNHLDDIPTLPVVASKINALINDPRSSVADIADIMKKDQVLTAKVLKLINSPYYGIPGGVTDVKRALAFLGFNTIAQLVLSLSVFAIFPDDKNEDFSIMQFWRHCLGVAVCSENIAKVIGYAKPEECFTCGLLHDVGKLVMFRLSKPTLMEIVDKAKREKKSFTQIESEYEFVGHSYLGEYMAKKWMLPQVISTSIRHHHTDGESLDEVSRNYKKSVQITALADALTLQEKIGNSGSFEAKPVQAAHLNIMKAFNLNSKHIEEIIAATHRDMEKAGVFLSVI